MTSKQARDAIDRAGRPKPRPSDAVGVALMLVALAVMVGWLADVAVLVQLSPAWVPMQFNTALGLLTLGIAIVGMGRSGRTAIFVAGGALLLLACATLAQYVFGIDLGIDEAVVRHGITVGTSHPGRMAPNTALCFLLSSGALLAVAGRRQVVKRMIAVQVLGLLVLVLSSAALLGYVFGSESAYGWGDWTRMAPHTAAALLIAAAMMTWWASEVSRRELPRAPLWWAGGLFAGVFLLDTQTPLGVAVGVAYVPLVFASLWYRRPRAAYLFAALGSSLIVLGYVASPPGETDAHAAVVNRALAITAVWITAATLSMYLRAVIAIERGKEQLELALEGGRLGLWDWNVPTGRVEYSSAWCEMVGYRQEELTPDFSTWERLLHPDDLPVAQKRAIDYVEGRLSDYNSIFRMRHRNGDWRWIQARGKIVETDEHGAPVRIAGTHLDITAERTAEEALRAERERFLSVLEYSPIGIALVAPDGSWLHVNPAICRIVGYFEDELLATDFQSITHPDDLDLDLGYLQQTLDGEIDGYEIEKRYFHKEGHVVWVLLTVSLVSNADGSPRHFISQIQDISRRKESEEASRRYLDELERSNQQLDDFAYIASHDLKEPLRAINNHSQFLLKHYSDQIDERGRHKLDRLGKLTARMQQLISDLLYFSRIGRSKESNRPVDVARLVEEQLDTLSAFLSERNARVIVQGELSPVVGDPARIATVFRNLVINGIKYNEQEQPRVTISSDPVRNDADGVTEALVTFHVEDNGIGIEPEFHDDIFKMFKRLHGEKVYGEGTGAGLAFVRKIVEQAGGSIWLDSTVGTGTTIHFTLPRATHEESG
ncbi:PAS domain S-box protein [Halomonas denitrificans]|nr:PAS domain S-box protein [Halomonas denitrificans]